MEAVPRCKIGCNKSISRQEFAPDRVTSDPCPTLWKPQTVQYPYERLEDMEPWLFVPGNYNGRIGVIWETCTACKMCVNICPNDCLHMTTELRVDVLDNAEGEDDGLVRTWKWRSMLLCQARSEAELEDSTSSLHTPTA